MAQANTLTELLIARKNEEKAGITFILSETEEIFVSYGGVYQAAAGLLYELQRAGFKRGDEVIFQIDDNRLFVFAFWACILGGMIPVPVTTGTNDEHKLKLFKIWEVLHHPRILASREFFGRLAGFAEERGFSPAMEEIHARAFFIDSASLSTEKQGTIHFPKAEDMAFIQFSSGSTGTPKGVILTHQNVLVNTSAGSRWANFGPEDSSLSWMPLTHDMGLIGTHITDVNVNIPQYNIHTQTFVRHPSLWLSKASEHKVTLLYSPNFGYKHFLKTYRGEDKGWDLSSVRLIYNGAEPISPELCNEFLDKMERYGLKRNAMYPVYGLAEGTIAVACPHPGEPMKSYSLNRERLKVGDLIEEVSTGDTRSVSFMELGKAVYDCAVRICDGADRDLGEKRVGYIQISGGNVTSGYYNNPEATAQAITEDGWLNTGDLGFMQNGRLTVTGRAKDIIFMAGQNYYSHDIERVAECVEGVELGKICAIGAFSEKRGQDELVLFMLFRKKLQDFLPLAEEIRRVIACKIGIEVAEVLPVKSIPKTTSGKVQRYVFRQGYMNGEYEEIKCELHALMEAQMQSRTLTAPQNETEEKLHEIWKELLALPEISTADDFFTLGGDSLKATQLLARIRDSFGIQLEQADIFENAALTCLAAKIECAARAEIPAIPAIKPEGDTVSLSFAQQRLWFLNKMNGESSSYNLHAALWVDGTPDIGALEKSLNAILERHTVLRTAFLEKDGKPDGRLLPNAPFKVESVDLVGLPEAERAAEALQKAQERAAKPFDLEKPPLLRVSVFLLGKNRALLVVVVHHIVFDGWSFGVLMAELEAGYKAALSGEMPMLEALPIQYYDYAREQAHRQEKGCCTALQKQLCYWKDKLNGVPALDLPTDRPRPAVQTFCGAQVRSTLPQELTNRLKGLAGEEKATLFMVLLAAFKVLLFRYSGQTDIAVGSPVAGRRQKETEALIGFFVNNLVLRTTFSGGESFRSLLAEVKKTALEAYANQDVSFEKLVEECKVERDMSRNPLFQVLFSLQNMPLPALDFPGMTLSETALPDTGTARFDLALDIREKDGALEAVYEYNTDLFNRGTVERLAGHYRRLLESAIENAAEAVERMEMLTAPEKNQLLTEWNDTAFPLGKCVRWTQLFEEYAAKTPNAPAVMAFDGTLTYAELNRQTNRLARCLKARGIKAETVTGVYLNRSTQMPAALIAIHKAGGAYLPLDPIFPRERIAYMLENAQAGWILTEKALADTLPENHAEVLCIEDLQAEMAAQDDTNLEIDGTPSDLAYLIYTSGSTGKPKGVQLEQGALTNFLLSMKHELSLTENDRLLAVTTLSFDIAGLELFAPLLAGACIVVADREEVLDGNRLVEKLNTCGITVMQATPATWRLMMTCGWEGKADLRILCGGEALPAELAEQLLVRCKTLFNMYGPTETTIWSTMDRVENSRNITVGRPIANTLIYIVDALGQPVPVGIPGELLIGGLGLARGYLKLRALTEEKFIPNPFGEGKLYRTGDLVKYRPDGKIEFCGRIDNQVKIRGFRIELGEIETILVSHPAVKQCVVVAKERTAGEAFLAGYMVPELSADKAELSPDKLRRFLKEKLPEYMVPSAFVVLEEFPKTPNGKIDRKALPMPESNRILSDNDYSAPDGTTEEKLIALWQEILQLERIGVNDNFFDLGGHSLLLMQVSSRIEKELAKKVSVMELFQYPTVRTLAAFMDGGKKKADEPAKSSSNRQENADIAVIGMSGRFPGAKSVEEFWENLCEGREMISHFSDEEVLEAGVDAQILKKPGYVKAWGVLGDVERFDANFFGYNPREAEMLDPQQRIFLEEAWKALENAGYDSQKTAGDIGVFASTGMNSYINNLTGSGSKGLANDYQIMISSDKDFLATRVAYKMNLQGPALSVQTACSSSLVAIHLACRSLLDGECSMALAGGVSIRLPQKTGYLYQEGMILSPDGHCRAFDANARGTVGGNGAGVVVLRRLSDAVANGDPIAGVIKGTAINNDGALKVGYTAPRIDGQAKAIAEAQNRAGVDPSTISYIEAHGTGTSLGDPIEMEALTQVFAAKTEKKQFCAVGSVKTAVGHLDAAAGVTGFIKVVLALKNAKLPPSLNYTSPNPKIDFANSPFYVNSTLADWKEGEAPRRAGVSAFGIGGTNAHAVLEEAPKLPITSPEMEKYLLVFSAKTPDALEKITENFADFLEKNPAVSLTDAAYTLQMGRREMECRRCLVCTSYADALNALKNRRFIQPSDSGKELSGMTVEETGAAWLAGREIDWTALYNGFKPRRMALPTYPFEGQAYWVKKSEPAVKNPGKKNPEISEWFYAPVFKQSCEDLLPAKNLEEVCLILSGGHPFAEKLMQKLSESGQAYTAAAGEIFAKTGERSFVFNSHSAEDYTKLLKEIGAAGKKPLTVVHLLGLTGTAETDVSEGEKQFFSVMELTKALGNEWSGAPVKFKVFTDHALSVLGEKRLNPAKILPAGLCKVIPREYPNISCTLTDILPDSANEADLLEALYTEITSTTREIITAYRGTQRFVQDFEAVALKEQTPSAVPLKEKGTYLITGGFGGMAQVFARYLAKEYKARLVLLSRSAVPDDSDSLRELRALGAEVLAVQADVTDAEQLARAKKCAEERFGAIDGVIHAAGNPGGGMLQMKKRAFVETVFAPKVTGTVLLYNLFKNKLPDFFLYCSSLNAVTGGFGQADYSAANAFMDAYAQLHDSRNGTRFVSIDWDRWPGVGMAGGNAPKARSLSHPLLSKERLNTPEKAVYSAVLSPADWVLSEHLVLSVPTLAGTTYLEMARAAFAEKHGEVPFEISDVLFLTPMAVPEGESRDALTVLEMSGEGYAFKIVSRGKDGWQEHARGKIAEASPEEKTRNLAELSEGCTDCIFDITDSREKPSQEFIRFGSRWQSLKKYSLGKDDGFAEIALNPLHESDLAQCKLHPSLLDVATGTLRLAGKGSYLPFSYGRLTVHAALTPVLYGHMRFKTALDTGAEILTCDMEVLDEAGRVLAEIENFSMKHIGESAAQNIKARSFVQQTGAEYAELAKLLEDSQSKGILAEGITEAEGTEAFRRILSGCYKPQVVVSTKEIHAAIEQASYFAQPDVSGALKENTAPKTVYPRPELDTEYVPAKNDAERKLVSLWQEVLGVDRVGIHDDFFALGGDSLLLIQFHAQLKELFETDIAVVDLYKYNTIALLAKFLTQSPEEEAPPSFAAVGARANKQLEIMQQRRQQMMNRTKPKR